VGFGHGFFDERRGVFGRLRATLRQITDFVGDYRETHAGLAGASRLDRRVQSQDIGLEGDLVDDFGNLLK
jgi:hypothetical protein